MVRAQGLSSRRNRPAAGPDARAGSQWAGGPVAAPAAGRGPSVAYSIGWQAAALTAVLAPSPSNARAPHSEPNISAASCPTPMTCWRSWRSVTDIGRLLALMHELDHNGLAGLLQPLRQGGARALLTR